MGRAIVRATVLRGRQPISGALNKKPVSTAKPPVATAPLAEDTANWTTEVRNGYTYSLDQQQRTRRVQGTLTGNPAQKRNTTAQLAAGGADRKTSDEGGHWIGRRFNGPKEAFNHFAQDRNFNRGKFKALENAWQRALDKGQQVVLDFKEIRYPEGSLRPSELRIDYTVDGVPYKVVFKNAAAAKP